MKNLIFVFACTSVLAPGLAHAQQMCVSQVGVCALSGGTPGTPCACFTPMGPAPGYISGMTTIQQQRLPQYCCTQAGKIGPLQNNGVPVGGVCSVVLPPGIPAMGQACY